MGKASREKRGREILQSTIKAQEGKFTVHFVFDGKVYERTHQLTGFEVSHMKTLCRNHGDQAADQLVWRTAVKGIGMVAENCMAKAAMDYIASHRVEPPIDMFKAVECTVYDDITYRGASE